MGSGERSVESAEQVRGIRGTVPWNPGNRSVESTEQIRGICGTRGAALWNPRSRSVESAEQVREHGWTSENRGRGTLDSRQLLKSCFEYSDLVAELPKKPPKIFAREPRFARLARGARVRIALRAIRARGR